MLIERDTRENYSNDKRVLKYAILLFGKRVPTFCVIFQAVIIAFI
jgi:hypothetical protein